MPFLDHLPELLVVLVVGALVFGTKRLPEMGSAVAQTIKSFQHGMQEITAAHDEAPTMPPVAGVPNETPLVAATSTTASQPEGRTPQG